MNDFDPADGWREVFPGTPDQYANVRALVEYSPEGKRAHVWVREDPVPPLPTEPGYYVDQDGCVWRLDSDGEWEDTFNNPMDDGQVQPPLERLEVRRETAKAVLDEVGSWIELTQEYERICRIFGVQP